MAIKTNNKIIGLTWAQLARLPLAFQSLAGLDRPLWRDYSRYQGLIDFQIAKAGGVFGMAARSSISWGYHDPLWPRNWHEAGAVGMYRTSYHVIYASERLEHNIGAGGRIMGRGQVDNWFEAHPQLDEVPRRMPRVIDLELKHDSTYQQIADATWDMSEIVTKRDGLRPIIYTRTGIVDTWLASWTEEMKNSLWWWLAQYNWDRVRERETLTLPKGVRADRVILHQTGDKKPGFPGEVESASVDYDRWTQGDAVEMIRFIEETWNDGEVTQPPKEEPVPDQTALIEELKEALRAVRLKAHDIELSAEQIAELASNAIRE